MNEQPPLQLNPPPWVETADGTIPFARPVMLIMPEAFPTPEPILLRDLPRKAAWADLLVFVVFWLGCEALAGSVLALFVPADAVVPENPSGEFLIGSLVFRVVVCLSAVALILRARHQRGDAVGLNWRSLGWNVLLGLPTLAIAACAVFGVMMVIVIAFPEAQRQAMENARILTDLIPRMPVVGYFGLMGMVGFYEEVVFRGFLMPRLRRGTESWVVAVLVSTVVFTIPHAANQTWLALIPVSILALTFSLATVLRRSIVPAVIAHALYNFGVIVYLHLYVAPGP